MRISGWSSDVCSSDLRPLHRLLEPRAVDHPREIAEGGEYRGGHQDHPPGRVAAHCPPQERRPGGGMGDGAIHVVDGEALHDDPIGRYRLADPATLHHMRSEEHTSELQSLMRISYAVFCL